MDSAKKALEYMTIGASLHDKDGNIIYANPLFCKLFNTTLKETNNKSFNDNYFKNKIKNPFNLEYIHNNINNIHDKIINIISSNTWIRVNSRTIKNGTEYYIITFDDISNSHNLAHLYENIFTKMYMGITIVKSTNGIDFFVKNINPFACKLNNIKNKTDIIGKDLSLFKSDKFNLTKEFSKIWKNDNDIIINNCKCVFNGITTWRNIKLIKVETGEIIFMYDDITDYVTQEEKLIQADKYKSQFLSNMSHEIRNPINSIVGFSELLYDVKNNDEKLNDYINIINNSSKALVAIIDDVLDFSKIEEGKLEINKKDFNLNNILNEVYLTSKENINDKIKFNLKKQNGKIYIKNDEFRLRQILYNLISNAIKFTNDGNIDIDYKIKNDKIIISVEDSGQGISKIDQTKLFKRFSQSKHNKGNIGHGLGLSISKELVSLMGGDMWVKSTFGKGSTFFFSLPYNNKSYKNKNIDKIDLYNINYNGKTILIVEDIEFNIKLLVSYLEETNANLIIATDGNDALIKYSENKDIIDIILMDIQLPEMDGTKVTSIIRTLDDETPIIAQTAYALRDEIDNIMSYGFNDLIKKPIRKEELIRIINKYIK